MAIKKLACLVLVISLCSRIVYGRSCRFQENPGSADSQSAAPSNDSPSQPAAPSNDSPELAPKRILGIVPNFRTTPTLKDYNPLTPRQKFKIATQDSFDPGAVVLGALFGGEGQLTNTNPSFGQGMSGYARYFAASYADFVIGNYMTEAVYPTMLHQDPRYFRRANGSAFSRMGSAVGQIFWTHTDSGRMRFNFSEILGNSTGVAISNAYYADNRNASAAATKLGIQIGVDMTANILKEFSPELNRLFSRKRRSKAREGH